MTPWKRKKDAFDPKLFLAHIGRGRKIVSFSKGRTVFAQGDSCDAVFYIQSGKVKLTVVSKTDNYMNTTTLYHPAFKLLE